MRQIVQLEGSTWCGPIAACMVLDHFGIPFDLAAAKERIAEYEGQRVAEFEGCRSDRSVGSFLTEYGLLTLFVQMGDPLRIPEGQHYWAITHKPRENRIATWYRVYDLIRSGYVAIVSIQRDAGKYHYVCVDDAFIRAQERWFSVICPIRGAYEEPAERFMLAPDGSGDATKWTFAKRMPARFASAAEFAAAAAETEKGA